MQKLYCPKCNKLLIKNADLIIDEPVVFSLEKIMETDNEVKTIVCHNCKRKIKYYVEKGESKC